MYYFFANLKGRKKLWCQQRNPCLREENFRYDGELEKDLYSFATVYYMKVIPKMGKISLGLREPDLYEITKDGIRV
ncbi:MAG: hypothetical protein MSA26_14275 [Lachnospiraceae bacterium]|nr:hypothetical protein [Lachnospiraceae bacterium]